MKILFVIPSITNYFTFLDELTASCIEDGIEVALVASPKHFDAVTCYDETPRCQYYPVSLPQGMNPVAHFKAAKELREIVKDFCPDIIHAHIGAAIFSVSMAKKRRWPLLAATHHGLLAPSMPGVKGKIASMAERLTFARVNRVYLLNASDKSWLDKKGIKKSIHVYKSKGIGCRTDLFDPIKYNLESKNLIRKECQLNADDFVFIYIGRHVWFKGFDLVIRAFLELNQQCPRTKLLVLGEPYSVHPSGLDDEEVLKMNENSSIVKLGWRNNVQDYLSVADVNVFPSEREGMPVNIMESLSMGVPVITRDTRGCNDLVVHDQNGYLMQSRSKSELLKYMSLLVDDSDCLDRLKNVSFGMREELSRERWIEEQKLEYQELLQG